MQIIKQNNLSIDHIVTALKEGKTIVYPTETCYGLGCDATNAEAVEKVFSIKQREEHKSVLIVVSDIEMAKRYVSWSPKIQELADKFWPGPLTIVADLVNGHDLAPGVIRGDGTIAFRVTEHSLVQELCQKLDQPIVSTSANIAGHESPYNIGAVLSMFTNQTAQPDIIIDGGELPFQSPSTIIRVMGDTIEVLRQGGIVVE